MGCQVDTFTIEGLFKIRPHRRNRPIVKEGRGSKRPRREYSPSSTTITDDGSDTPSRPVITDMNPRSGSRDGGERLWVTVHNLRRDNNHHYHINFGDSGNVAARLISPECDTVQMLECETPPSAAGTVYPSLRLGCDPGAPFGIGTTPFTFMDPSDRYVLCLPRTCHCNRHTPNRSKAVSKGKRNALDTEEGSSMVPIVITE